MASESARDDDITGSINFDKDDNTNNETENPAPGPEPSNNSSHNEAATHESGTGPANTNEAGGSDGHDNSNNDDDDDGEGDDDNEGPSSVSPPTFDHHFTSSPHLIRPPPPPPQIYHVAREMHRGRDFRIPALAAERAQQQDQRERLASRVHYKQQHHRQHQHQLVTARLFTTQERAFWYNRSYFHLTALLRMTHARSSSFWRVAARLAWLMAYVMYDDFRVWRRLYGTAGAVAVGVLARKQVWRLLAAVLAAGVEEVGGFGDLERLAGDTATRRGSGEGGKDGGKREWVHASDVKEDEEGEDGEVEGKKGEGSSEEKVSGEQGETLSPATKEPRPVPFRIPRRLITIGSAAFSVAGLEFKKAVESESQRISTAGSIITGVAMATLALPNLSQTHWVARSCWVSSLITSLLAVYFATSQAWTISQLTSEKDLRRWVRNTEDADNDGIRLWMALNDNDDNDDNDDSQNKEEERSEQLLASLAPASSSTITVSAPSLLLSSSLLLLLAGMGVFLGFVWSRDLDVDAGVGDSKSVFVVYVVVLGFSLALTGVFALGQRPVPARSIILDSLMKLDAAPTAEKVEKSDLVGYRQLLVQKEIRDLMQEQRLLGEKLLRQMAVLREGGNRAESDDGEKKGKKREAQSWANLSDSERD
ncbi:hypothetical protein MFIFM68171_03761 [Madurella fahalii]|uniref:Uncharacterized protein n=1 Tax=Madurella fahalii TaxID=1157608 RepID=A0ABQ0G719_9PEZI